MADFIEVAGKGLLGGNSIAGLGSLSSAGVSTLANLPRGEFYYAEETVSIVGNASTTATATKLIQPNSLVLFCGAKIGTALVTATTVSVVATSDTTNSVLIGAFTTYTAGYEPVLPGRQWLASNSNAASGPFFIAASGLTVKYTGTPTAGTIRLWVFGLKFSAPAA